MELESIEAEQLKKLLPWPAENAHKYSRGKLVAVVGSAAYPGAACLAACAAQRMGAGYVEVVCAPESTQTVRVYRPSLVVRAWDTWEPLGGLVTPDEAHPTACLVGSGFEAQGYREQQLLGTVLQEVAAPVIVDGGAIAALATSTGLALAHRRAQRGWLLVVTPHAGEAARMEKAAGLEQVTSQAQRAQNLATAYHCVIALKGADTFISDGTRVAVMQQGTAALAKAGTGDVLSGMIGALLAQRLEAFDAALVGATLHAQAGRIAAEQFTEICVSPEDVIECIPQAIRLL